MVASRDLFGAAKMKNRAKLILTLRMSVATGLVLGVLTLPTQNAAAAYVASVELAPGKARTAALFKKPSQALEDAINHGRIAAVMAHGFIEMQGGLPIVVDGQVIGGIGASFDTPEHDVQIAQAGLAALNR